MRNMIHQKDGGQVGKTISHYKILEKIGGGGMGTVYKAKDTKLKRTVALKFLPHDLTRDPEAKKRFIKEAQAASALDHPNICTIHEIDETEDGQMFICMACYEGETLKKKIEQGPLKLEEAVDIAVHVAQGLAKAHSKRIVHRDIKPANIFITEDDQVKILDFGLAKLAGESKITKKGTTVGTVAYMSPEQARGEGIDHRTDIWSLGIILYEMLTGQLPFKGENFEAVIYSIFNEEPQPIRHLRSDVPVRLQQLVLNMMQKEARKRYKDVKSLITDLKSIDLQKILIKEERKLAAIMFTDIHGFTRLMAKDEPATIRMLEEQTRIMKELISQHKGRLVKTMGDAVMVDFKSAVNAVRCGIEIQKEIRKYNENRPDKEKLMVRIGIHIGDVVVQAEDIYGDGVNVAKRIEALAEPGCICISKDVYNRVKSLPDINTVSLGLKQLKHIEEPLEVYKVVTEGALPPKAVKEAVAERGAAINSIAVLPFLDMTPQKDQEYFCDGMAEELINALTHIKDLRVVARTSAFSFKGKDADIHEISRKLNVTTLLEGSVRKAGNRLRISAQLINVADGYHLWAERYDRELEDVFAIQDEITLEIVDKLKVKLLRGEKAKLLKRHTEDMEAYNLYLKGRYFWNKRTGEGMKKGIEYFQKAIEKDPTYALAYAGLADSYSILGFWGFLPPKDAFPKAKAAAKKALEMDDTLAEAHTSLGFTCFVHDWNWSAAESGFKRAIELNPGYAPVRHWYACYLICMGRFDEGITEMKRALELNPLSLIINSELGNYLLWSGRLDESIEQLLKTLEMDPNVSMAHYHLGCVYNIKGRYKEAIAAHQRAMELGLPFAVAGLGCAYAMSGERAKAEKILYELKERSKERYVSPLHIGLIYFRLGEINKTFEWLEKAYKERDPIMFSLKTLPEFEPLRSDPRFRAMLKKMALDK